MNPLSGSWFYPLLVDLLQLPENSGVCNDFFEDLSQ